MNNQVFHFYRADASKSSRINAQLKIDNGKVFDSMRLLDRTVLYAFFKESSRGDTFVFHQQSSLVNLTVCFLLNFFIRKVKFVYDMHDFLEYDKGSSFKSKTSFFVFLILEFFVSLSNIKVLTVSDGLSKLFFLRYNKSANVFYNIPYASDIVFNEISEFRYYDGRCIYFGLINKRRLPFELLEFFNKNNLVLDVYGFFDVGVERDFFFGGLEEKGVINYLGEYSPESIVSIVSSYTFSLIYIPDSRVNIRFCLPNKLFQSFSAGVRCVVSDNLREVNIKFGNTSSIFSLSDVLKYEPGDVYSNADVVDKINKMKERSLLAYFHVIGRGDT